MARQRRGRHNRSDLEARSCTCLHPRIEHERNRETLQWDGPCRALNVTHLPGGAREVTACQCEQFTQPDESGPCRHCSKPKQSHRGTIGHSYEAKV